MIGTLIGGALKIGSSIFGGVSASNAMKQAKENLNNQMRANKSWYDQRYNEDSTQRADAQRILTMTQDAIRNRNKAIAGSQAVAGGTEEAVAAEKARNNAMMADATSRIAAAGDARKDTIEQTYMKNKSELNNQMNNMDVQRAQNISKAVEGVGSVAADLAGDFDSDIDNFFKKKK